MYICVNCNEMFDSPNLTEDFTSEYFGSRIHHMISTCPYCGSDELDTAYRCVLCGEYHSGANDYCEDCDTVIHEFFDPVIDEVSEKYGFDKDKVREALKDIY